MRTGLIGEVQHLFRSHRFSITSGIGYVDIDGEFTYHVTIFMIQLFLLHYFFFHSQSSEEADVEHGNLYVYSNINVTDNLTVTVGASGDFYQDEVFDKDQINPKFGLTWNPTAKRR